MLNAGKFSPIADGNDEAIVWVCTVVGNLEGGCSGERDMRVWDATSVTRCFDASPATTTRDLADLVEKGALALERGIADSPSANPFPNSGFVAYRQ